MVHMFVAGLHMNDEFGIVDVAVHVHSRPPAVEVDPVPHGVHTPLRLYVPAGHGTHDFVTVSSVYPSEHVGVHVVLSVHVVPFIE
jgi:hypothetical protein